MNLFHPADKKFGITTAHVIVISDYNKCVCRVPVIIEMFLETGLASGPTPGAPFIVSDPLSGGEHTNVCINVWQRSAVDVRLHKLMT